MRFVTLGPEGSCHENAVRKYLEHHGVAATLMFVDDPLEGLELVKSRGADFLVQCSAHLNVHLVTERHFREVVVTDTFLYPTRDIVLLERIGVESPQTLGSVRAADGYLEGITYPKVVYETTKPIVGRNLVAGAYDAGLTTMEFHDAHPGRFRIRRRIGRVLTTWIVFGRMTVFEGDVLGVARPGFYQDLLHAGLDYSANESVLQGRT